MASFVGFFPEDSTLDYFKRLRLKIWKSYFQQELYVTSKSIRTWKFLHKNKIRLTFWFLFKIVFDALGEVPHTTEQFQHSLTFMFIIVLVMVMAYPNQLLGMTYPNHQTVLPFENPTNSEFPPPYCVNEQNCTNGSNENAVGQYQPMWLNRERWIYLRHWLKLLLLIHWQKHYTSSISLEVVFRNDLKTVKMKTILGESEIIFLKNF